MISAYIPISIGNVRKNKFSDYAKKEWNDVWNHKLFQYLRYKMVSPEKMNFDNFECIPELGKGKISFDILTPSWRQEMDELYLELLKESGKR